MFKNCCFALSGSDKYLIPFAIHLSILPLGIFHVSRKNGMDGTLIFQVVNKCQTVYIAADQEAVKDIVVIV